MKSLIPAHFYYALIVFFLIQGCTPDKQVDREAVRKEMADREIKRVTMVELLEKGKEIGNEISQKAQEELQKNLLEAIGDKGIAYALQFCSTSAIDIVREVEDSTGARILRVSHKFRNPADEPDSLESLILEAYQYSHDNGTSIDPAIQEEDDRYLLYNKPIIVANALCLNCHGEIGTDISEENYDVISSLYPSDGATGYKLGDLRGMWSIRIPKKVVVHSL